MIPRFHSDDTYEIGDAFTFGGNQGVVADVREGSFGKVYIVRRNGVGEDLKTNPLRDLSRFDPAWNRERQNYDAFKTLKESHLIPFHAKNFYAEAQAWLTLEGCPNVVRAIEIIQHPRTGRPFVRMPLYPLSLRDVLVARPNGIGIVASLVLVARIVEGLRAAAERNFRAHLDLKPENVMCGPLPVPVERAGFIALKPDVCDFGMARLKSSIVGLKGGTPGYQAPEQYGSWDEATLGPWSDAFALGVMLCELATGLHPFGVRLTGASASSVPGSEQTWERWAFSASKIRNEAMPAGSRPELRALFGRCLATPFRERPQSYEELQVLLEAEIARAEPEHAGELRTIIHADRELAVDLGFHPGQVTIRSHLRRIANLAAIDRKRAQEEARAFWKRGLEAESSAHPKPDDLRLGALAGQLLSELDSSFSQAPEIYLRLLRRASTVRESCADPGIPIHIADPSALSLAQDAIEIVRRCRGSYHGISEFEEIHNLVKECPRLSPYLSYLVAGDLVEINDFPCAFWWIEAARNDKPGEPEFWVVGAIWISTYWMFRRTEDLAEKLAPEACQHERAVPWDDQEQAISLGKSYCQQAQRLAPTWAEPDRVLRELDRLGEDP